MVQMITAAVAPVVLVSAAAILLGSINTRYTSLSSQFRMLTAEHRDPGTAEKRRRHISVQISLFYWRINAVWISILFLSLSIVLFIASILVLFVEAQRRSADSIALWLIGIGLVCMALSLVLEVAEIVFGRRTLCAEMADVSPDGPGPIDSSCVK